MAIALTPLLTLISNCDTADWSGGALDTEKMRQGAACLAVKASAVLSIVYKYDQGGAAGVDMTGQHFFVWMMSTSTIETLANGGFRIYAEDKNGAWKEWYVGGSDNYGGGWQRFCASSGATAQNSSGTYDPLYHRYLGVRFYTTGKSTVNNCFWDFVHYGSGLKVTSAATDTITWQNIYDADNTAAYGIVSKLRGLFFVQGRLEFGDTSTLDISFGDTSQIVIFQDSPRIASTLYQVVIQGRSGGTTKFVMGTKSGESGVSGCILKSGGATKFSITATSTYITELKLYGCVLLDAGTISLPADATGREVLNCTFEACAKALVSTCIVKNCNFISSDADAILVSSTTFKTTYCNFINCPNGVEIDTYGVGYSFSALIFSNTTYHVNNSCGQALTIGNANGSNASTYTGSTVTFTTSVQLTMTVKNEATPPQPIVGAFAYIDDIDESPFIMNTTTDGSGVATVLYQGSPVNNSRWRVRKYGFRNFKQLIDIGSSNISLPVTLAVDPQQT